MKDERLIVRTMERLGIATAYGNRTQAIDYLNRTLPASCGFVAYNPFMPARVGWENYTIYIGGEDDMQKARILEGELAKWFNVRYEQYPRTSGTHVMMNISVRAKGHLIGAYMGGGGQQEPDALNFTMPNGGTITLTRTGSPTTVTLEYTLDGGATWTEWEEVNSVRTLTLNAGEKVYIRNTSTSSTGFSTSINDYYQFAMTDTTEAHGNVNSLLCKNPNDAVLTPYCYRALFRDSSIVTAPKLPSTTLADYCYHSMFVRTNLTAAPELPSTTLAVGCYYAMFRQSLIEDSPILRAETLLNECYAYMFYYTYSLKTITTYMNDIAATDCLSAWVSNVASVGDFYCPASLTIPTGAYGIPSGWTRHDL